jgi:hypothetical protein
MDAGDQGIINDRRGVQLNAPTTNDRAEKTRDPDDVFSMMSPRRGTLSVVVRTYKAAVTTGCRAAGHAAFGWQRGFYEHVVRNGRELEAIRRYIRDNPRRWALDRDNLANARGWPPPVAIGDYLAELAAYDRETP